MDRGITKRPAHERGALYSLRRAPWEKPSGRARVLARLGWAGEMTASVSARHGRLTTRRRPQT